MKTIIELYDLTGKTAFITGGTRGLGLQMAEGLAEAGANVVLASANPDNAPPECAALLAKLGPRSLVLPMQVTDREATHAAVAKAVETFGTIDVCIACAGINDGHPLATEGLETWEKIMAVNVTGTFLTCGAVAPHMKAQRSGSIITVSSIYGMVGMDKSLYTETAEDPFEFPAYQASKGAVVNLTREMACSLGRFNIRANCLCPATFVSDQNRHILQGKVLDRINARTPLGRTGEADDLKGVAVFLASEASKYITGTILPVDGGWTAW
jgi:gluconate 5-dehydrogenase